jgi:aminopeptidase N
MLPCQDAPQVKATYDAKVTVPAELTAVMSAISTENTEANGKKTFGFKQDVPMCVCTVAVFLLNPY